MRFRYRLPLFLSFFFPPRLRIGIFVAGATAANAYGGVLGYELSDISTAISPPRLLFILEGVPTCFMAVVVWFSPPDAPGEAKFLKPGEHKVAVPRAMRQPQAYQRQGLDVKHPFPVFKDYKSNLKKRNSSLSFSGRSI